MYNKLKTNRISKYKTEQHEEEIYKSALTLSKFKHKLIREIY